MAGKTMIDTTMKPSRILVKDGAWQVPPEDRPRGWESYGLTEAPRPPEPTQEDIAGVMAEIAAQIPQDGTEAGKRWREMRRQFKELTAVLPASAEYVGTQNIAEYGYLLIAGMFTRSKSRCAMMSGLRGDKLDAAMKRLTDSGIWGYHEGMLTVHMGDENDEIPDLGLWLNAMVAAGEIKGTMDSEGKMTYISA